MKFPKLNITHRRGWLLLGTAIALNGVLCPAHAERGEEQQAANSTYTAPASKLHVTGTVVKFTVDADHADIQSVLKAVFDQAGAQFTTDNNVVGQVTLRLTDQPLPTTLDTLCRQLLLRYHKNDRGIYLFEQDIEATRAAITRLRDLNALTRQQLRTFGISLPDDSTLDAPAFGMSLEKGSSRAEGGAQQPAASGFGGGGNGGQAQGTYGRGAGRPAVRSLATPGQGGSPGPAGPAGPVAEKSANVAPRYNYLTESDINYIFAVNPQTKSLLNPTGYRSFLQQNGLVYINTGGQKAPVVEVLQELGKQSNTRILLDPSVPSGPKFNMQGYITPRSLPEALNVLTQSTRLSWSWLGNAIYVTALPDFQSFYNSNSPRMYYGGAYPLQQRFGERQNTNAASSAGSQPPLPVTNGEKKTP